MSAERYDMRWPERHGAVFHLTMALINEGVDQGEAEAAAEGLLTAYLRTGSKAIEDAIKAIEEVAWEFAVLAKRDGVRR